MSLFGEHPYRTAVSPWPRYWLVDVDHKDHALELARKAQAELAEGRPVYVALYYDGGLVELQELP